MYVIFIVIREFCTIYCKTMLYFPLNPHLEGLFCSHALAKLMILHKDHKSAHGVFTMKGILLWTMTDYLGYG
jgi:hypothetical protein